MSPFPELLTKHNDLLLGPVDPIIEMFNKLQAEVSTKHPSTCEHLAKRNKVIEEKLKILQNNGDLFKDEITDLLDSQATLTRLLVINTTKLERDAAELAILKSAIYARMLGDECRKRKFPTPNKWELGTLDAILFTPPLDGTSTTKSVASFKRLRLTTTDEINKLASEGNGSCAILKHCMSLETNP